MWFAWVAASTVGWGVAGPLGMAMGSSWDVIVAVCVGGILAGLLQWLVLRRYLARAGWWVLANIGAAAAVGVVVVVLQMDSSALGAGAALGGTVLAVPQWWVLRSHVGRASWWVPAATVGWIAGGFLSGAFPGGVLGWATIGGVYGAITGVALVWLLRGRLADAGRSATG